MKLLADESIESEIVTALRFEGHEVLDFRITTPGIEDSDVLSMANEAGAVLLTNDKDFGDLVYRDGLFSNGVILIRLGKLNINERVPLIADVIEEHGGSLQRAFTVITPTGIRIRK